MKSPFFSLSKKEEILVTKNIWEKMLVWICKFVQEKK